MFQGSFKKTFKVFQKMFYVAWHSSQLPEQKEGLFFSCVSSSITLNFPDRLTDRHLALFSLLQNYMDLRDLGIWRFGDLEIKGFRGLGI